MKPLSELPWRCPEEMKDFVVLEALVSPPNPLAFYLLTKETLLAAIRDCRQGVNGFDSERCWEDFKVFADGDWTPTRIVEWLEAQGLNPDYEL